MLEQDSVGATVYARAGGAWTHDSIAGSIIALPEIGAELPLAELYEGIAFDDEPEAEAPGG